MHSISSWIDELVTKFLVLGLGVAKKALKRSCEQTHHPGDPLSLAAWRR